MRPSNPPRSPALPPLALAIGQARRSWSPWRRAQDAAHCGILMELAQPDHARMNATDHVRARISADVTGAFTYGDRTLSSLLFLVGWSDRDAASFAGRAFPK